MILLSLLPFLHENLKAILKCSQKFYATIILSQTDVHSYVRISD